MLTNGTFGAVLRGVILKVDEPRNFTGKNDRGAYDVWSRRMEVFCGQETGTVIVADRANTVAELPVYQTGSLLEARITSARMDGKQLVLSVK